MYPSHFYQPVYHQSPRYERRSQPVLGGPCRTAYVDYHQAIQHQRQRDTERRAQTQLYAAQRQREREEQVLQLLAERERALQREARRRLLAQREYERHLERKSREEQAVKAWYAARVAERRRAEGAKRETREREFAEFLDSLFHASQPSRTDQPSRPQEAPLPRRAEPETEQAQAFSDSEGEEQETADGVAMDRFLNALFEGIALRRDSTPSAQPPSTTVAGTKPEDGQQDGSPTTAPEPFAAEPAESVAAPQTSQDTSDSAENLEDIQQRYTSNKVRVERLETLDTLFAKLDTLKSGFTFPAALDFQDIASSPSDDDGDTPSIPALTYSSTNVPYHSHAQSLLGLLVEADAVESDGDEEVRRRRKEFVRSVEVELDALERRKGEVWKAMRG